MGRLNFAGIFVGGKGAFGSEGRGSTVIMRMAGFGAERKLMSETCGFRICPRPWKNASYEVSEAL